MHKAIRKPDNVHPMYYLESHEEAEVLLNSETIEEDIVLWTDTQTLSNLIHVSEDTVAIDGG